VDRPWSGTVESETLLRDVADNSGSFDTVSETIKNTGATPNDGNFDMSTNETLFYNNAGRMVGNKGFEMASDGNMGEFTTGGFTFHQDGGGNWTDQDGNPWNAEDVDNAYANLLRREKNINKSESVDDAWLAANPLAVGDVYGTGKAEFTGQGTGTENDPLMMSGIEARSSNDYLEKRQDINDPRNIPTGTGGSGDGMFSFLKDFKLGFGN